MLRQDVVKAVEAGQFHIYPVETVDQGIEEEADQRRLLDVRTDHHPRRVDQREHRDPEAVAHAVQRSCEIKAEVVALDEREAGRRAILNFGHTFGHAIEHCLGYGEWLHGEAVGAGMCMAATMSNQMGWMSDEDTRRTINLIEQAKLPTTAPASMRA